MIFKQLIYLSDYKEQSPFILTSPNIVVSGMWQPKWLLAFTSQQSVREPIIVQNKIGEYFLSITPERSPSIVFLSVWHRRLKCYAVTDSRTLCCRLLLGNQAFSFWPRVAHSYLIDSRSIPWVFIIHMKQHATQFLGNLFKIYFYQKCLRNVLVFSR